MARRLAPIAGQTYCAFNDRGGVTRQVTPGSLGTESQW